MRGFLFLLDELRVFTNNANIVLIMRIYWHYLLGFALLANTPMEKKYYITTAIDYVNGLPHIGHALEKVQADVLARYHRQKGDEVFFLTGTDEHGAKVVRAAEAAGKTPQEFTDEISARFKALKEALNLSWDDFIRTTDKERHWPGVNLMWHKLVQSGDIYKKKYRGLYCVGHEAFVTEKDLVDGKCGDHDAQPEVIEEENYFFKLSKYSKEIKSRIQNREFRILPETRANEVLALIEGPGLEDVSFSRPRKDLSWGIPVPDDSTQTVYVWGDALTNYLSAMGYGRHAGNRQPATSYQKWWPADIQIIGKDILRFHAAIWPGMLLSAGLPLPKQLLVHGFVTVDGRKMSKTLGNVVDPFELVKKYGTDAVRYYLLKEIPSGEDGDFGYKKFEQVYNGELANGLGNFAARVLGVARKLGKIKVDFKDVENQVEEKIAATRKAVEQKLDDFRIHEAVFAINDLISFGDKYVNDNKVWEYDDSKFRPVVNLIVILDNVAGLLLPFLPETADKIFKSINWLDRKNLEVREGRILFPRLDE